MTAAILPMFGRCISCGKERKFLWGTSITIRCIFLNVCPQCIRKIVKNFPKGKK